VRISKYVVAIQPRWRILGGAERRANLMAQTHLLEEDSGCLPILHVFQLKDPARMIVVGCCSTCGAITLGIYESKSTSIHWEEKDTGSSYRLSKMAFLEWLGKM
jgi:hypothetical protein